MMTTIDRDAPGYPGDAYGLSDEEAKELRWPAAPLKEILWPWGAVTFAFGAGLAGLAGAMIVPLYGISADLGARFLIQAFYSALLGGIGGFIEPVLGAVVVGSSLSGFQWLRNISGLDQFTSPVSIDVMVFLVILIVVKLRPDGIFTSKQ